VYDLAFRKDIARLKHACVQLGRRGGQVAEGLVKGARKSEEIGAKVSSACASLCACTQVQELSAGLLCCNCSLLASSPSCSS
jgi:hypothetical protein